MCSLMKRVFQWLAILIVAGSGLGTLLGFLAPYGFLFNTLVHFRLQYAVAAAGSLLLFGLLRQRTGALISFVVLAINLWFIVPLYLPNDTSLLTKLGPPTKILLMNVLSSNRQSEAVEAQIDKFQPDILVLQEINRFLV